MDYYMDTEFFENGKTIELISLAMVDGNGEELYLIDGEFPLELYSLQTETAEFLRKHVVPFLPVKGGGREPYEWDKDSPAYQFVFSRTAMRKRILDFMLPRKGPVVLWANCGTYDMVALKQLWGDMRAQDPIMPYYCNDLQQLLRDRVISPLGLPRQDPATEHHALGDARHLKECVDFCRGVILHRNAMVRGES